MSREVTEALLEMHFYAPIRTLLETTYGRRVLKIMKPSPQDETWVGFDLGFAKTGAATPSLAKDISSFIHGGTTTVPSLLLGFFLQFKVVDLLTRRSNHLPKNLAQPITPPYYRSELSLIPNKHTGISQHETLLRLAKLPNTSVDYVCPLIVAEEDLHEPPSLNQLRIVPVNTAPTGWASHERHFILFPTATDPPFWCSDAAEGQVVAAEEWATRVSTIEPSRLEGWLRAVRTQLADTSHHPASLPNSLWIVALGEHAS